jgi:molecular chaperone DnaJ
MSDYYSILGVSRDATADQIKTAYRRAASQHHPDKGGDKEQFQKIQEAYATLGDEQKRAQYDNPAPQFGTGGGGFHFNFGPGGFNFADIFGAGFPPGFGPRAQPGFVRMSLWIRLSDAATGGRRPVSIATAQGNSVVEIEIPLGINDGDTIRYSGIAPGGQDLAVQFRIHPDKQWERNGLDLTTERNISVWDLILGADVTVNNILGKDFLVTVPPRTQPRTTLRVRGQGLRDGHGNVGDMFVRVNVVVPDNINPDLLTAIEKYRR